MFCKLTSYSLNGITPSIVNVEVDLSDGLPNFEIVGLPDSVVRESKERVKSAIKNSGFKFPARKITINLSPADVKKEGCIYDLPIALGILCCMGEIDPDALKNALYIGELALDGTLRGIKGLLPILCDLTPKNTNYCVIPTENQKEASLVQQCTIYLANTLNETIDFVNQHGKLQKCSKNNSCSSSPIFEYDFADVKGQERAKRGLMLCAAGYHNALLIGPPGSGKTMLAKRLISILPPLSTEESIEVTKVYSVANKLSSDSIIHTRPFRSPHHTITPLGLTGGGLHPIPGEISLAHLGVLFLDELLEFNKHALEVLRQPLEEHQVTLSRVNQTTTYPANFLFVASTNPCPCGYYPNTHKCSCSMNSIKHYLSKLSGPLLDRIDVQIETHMPTLNDLNSHSNLSSSDMREHISEAILTQKQRYKNTSIKYNSQIPAHQINTYCSLSADAKELLNNWFTSSSSSIRAYDKIIRLSLTLSDLCGSSTIQATHISEAIQYRTLDRDFWT